MATKSTALPGVMKGSTVGTGTVSKASSSGSSGNTASQLNSLKNQMTSLQNQLKNAGTATGGTQDTALQNRIAQLEADAAAKAKSDEMQAQLIADQAKAKRQSAYDLLAEEFNRYGLGSLVEPLKNLVQENVSPAEFAIRLQQTDAYKQRFSANADRIAKGLTALTPAEYIGMEDQYQNIMRQYGLPASYYAKDSTGKQPGFDQLLANDVSQVELEDRVMTAQNRVVNANPEVYKALKSFYPDITNGDILAYTLDPTKALDMIKRKVTAAEIGGAALASGLTTEAAAAENLAKYGITKAQAQQGYGQIAELLPRASQLSDIYNQGPYNQAAAEADIFNTASGTEATAKRKKLSELEKAQFSGQSGTANNALSRDRAMSQMQYMSPGAGAF